MQTLAIVLALLLIFLTGPLMALAMAPKAVQGAPVLVVARDAAAVVAAAGGRIVGPTTAPMAVLATGDSGLINRLRASKAWLVTEGRWIAQLCGRAT